MEKEMYTLEGITIFPGNVEGIAKIVSSIDDVKNFKENEIIVSKCTKDRMMKAIYQSKAILTCDHGILSHAAIVSRELEIPCIIGIKGLLENVKTGYLIKLETGKPLSKGIIYYKKIR